MSDKVFSATDLDLKKIHFDKVKTKRSKKDKNKSFNSIQLYYGDGNSPVYIQTHKCFSFGIQNFEDNKIITGHYCNISLKDMETNKETKDHKSIIKLVDNIRKLCAGYIFENRLQCGFKEENTLEYINMMIKDNIHNTKEGHKILGTKLIGNGSKIYSNFYDSKVPLNQEDTKIGKLDPFQYINKHFYMIGALCFDSLYITKKEIKLNINLSECIVYEITNKQHKRLITVFPLDISGKEEDEKEE